MKNLKKWILSVCFLCVLAGTIIISNQILEQKYSKDAMRGFYDLPKDTLDVAFIGSSHMLNGVLPVDLWDNYGIRAYNAGQHGQRLSMTYYYMKEVIDKQHPKVMVIDLFYVRQEQANDDIANLHKSIDNLQWGKNKWDAILKAVPKEYRWEVMYPSYLYHSRWNELSRDDFTYLTNDAMNPTGGTELRWGHVPLEVPEWIALEERLPIDEDTTKWLSKILELGKETNTRVVFTVLPHVAPAEAQAMYHTAGQMAVDAGEYFLDFMYLADEIGLDYQSDMYDSEHLNPYGARKVTEYLGGYLVRELGLTNHKEDTSADIAYWQKQSKMYEAAFKAGQLGNIADITEYMQAIQDDSYVVALAIWADEVKPGDIVLDGWEELGLNPDIISHRSNQYVALIDGGKVIVDLTSENEALVYEKTLYGVDWQLTSQDGGVSIMTDLQEMAANEASINMVVYDKILKKVVDSVSVTDTQEIIR